MVPSTTRWAPSSAPPPATRWPSPTTMAASACRCSTTPSTRFRWSRPAAPSSAGGGRAGGRAGIWHHRGPRTMSDPRPTQTAVRAPAASPGELPPGFVVGEYRIEGVAGRGGMGVVYAALQPVIEKKVAIKVLNAQLSADVDLVRRFVDEARAVNRIGHENIIDIFSFGQLADGRQYFVMEYLEGA